MRRVVAVFAAACLFLLAFGVTPAGSTHKPGHQRPPACEKNQAKFQAKKKANKKKAKKTKKSNKANKKKGSPNQKNKHCYPPRSSPSRAGGSAAAFTADLPRQPGITVGMAAIAAIGALGALLVLRRRWAFHPRRTG